MLEAESFTVSQKLQKISGGISTRNNHDVSDAGINQRLNRVVDHGLIIDGQQVFVRDGRQRPQTRTQSSCKYDTFHDRLPRANNSQVQAREPWSPGPNQ